MAHPSRKASGLPQDEVISQCRHGLAPSSLQGISLPPYDVLDPILKHFIEYDRSVEQIVAEGFDHDTVVRVLNMIKRNEYKRRQAPPGVRISRRAFGRDWRYPITSGY